VKDFVELKVSSAMLGNTKTSTKIFVGFLMTIAIAMAIGLVGKMALSTTEDNILTIGGTRLPASHSLQQISTGQLHAATALRALVVRRAVELQTRQDYHHEFERGLRMIEEGRKGYDALSHAPEEAHVWQRVAPAIDEWVRSANTTMEFAKQKDVLLAQGTKTDDPRISELDDHMWKAIGETRQYRVTSEKLIDEIVDVNGSLAKADYTGAIAASSRAQTTILWTLIGGVLLSLSAAWLVARSIKQNLDALVRESAKLSEAAIQGRLQTRGDPAAVSAEFRPIIIGVNDTLDAVIGPLNVAADYVDKISKGNIPAKITDSYNGDFNTIKNNLNQCIDGLGGLTEANEVLQRMTVNDHSRPVTGKYSGLFAEVGGAVNEVQNSVKHITAVLVRISNGDLSDGVSLKALGNGAGKRCEQDQLAPTVIRLIDGLGNLVTDAAMLSNAALEGKLATRADVSKHQGDYRKVVQGVNDTLNAVIGPLNVAADYVDKISKGNIPAKITDTYNGDFNTIKNNLNQCIDGLGGLVEANDVLKRMTINDYSRPVAGKYAGLFAEVGAAVNEVQNRINFTISVLARISNGDLSDGPTLKALGGGTGRRCEQDQLAPTVIRLIDGLGSLVADAAMLSSAALEGKLAARADVSKHQGDYRKVVQGVNDTLNAVIGPLNVAADYVDKISKGNIPPKITDAYNGDFNTIKNNLNRCVEAVNALVTDTDALVKASIEGKLSTRADATKHAGDFRKVVEGVNRTLDAVISPVMDATNALESLSRYDMRVRITAEYQGDHARIKDAVNGTAKALQDALLQVSEAVEQVSEASQQIASSSQAVSQGASEQASSLEETSSSLEEMAGMTKQNADNTIQARSLAQTTKEAAEKGGKAMVRMTDAMEKIRAASEGTAEIIKDINDIAFQTNLLALNAAVEAARAGDAGRGFAVVAEEVRNLALRSKEAAKKTEDLIKVAVGHSENGRVITNEVAGSLTEIVTAAGKVNTLVSEIAVASQEQSRGIEQVNKAVAEMDKVVQSAAANAEESSSAAEELASQSEELSSLVGRFELDRENAKSVRKSAGGMAKEHGAQRRGTPHPATIPPRRAGLQNTRAKKPNGSNGSAHKPTPEDIIPLESDPEFQDF
jgi:methyl-accepting chemotaxis protein